VILEAKIPISPPDVNKSNVVSSFPSKNYLILEKKILPCESVVIRNYKSGVVLIEVM